MMRIYANTQLTNFDFYRHLDDGETLSQFAFRSNSFRTGLT